MAELIKQDQQSLVQSKPGETAAPGSELLLRPKTKEEQAEGWIKGSLSVAFVALLMFLGNWFGTTSGFSRVLAMATGGVVIAAVLVAAAAYRYGKSPDPRD